MRIAMLGVKSVPAIGGIARYVEELGARLVERGHEVTVYCRPHYMDGDDSEYRGMRRIVTRGWRGKHLDALTHTLTAALHARREHYDVIHFHGMGPAALAPLVRRRGCVPVVTTVHGLDWRRSKWGGAASLLMAEAARVTARASHRLVAVSGHDREAYERHTRRPVEVIPTGVDLPALPAPRRIGELGLEPGRYIFCAARSASETGLHRVVEAFSVLDTDKRLVVAGKRAGESEYFFRLLANHTRQVLVPGHVTGALLAELYAFCYAYVQPSLVEGASPWILEALSYGCCVLASDIPANREALGPCGYTFRAGDLKGLLEQIYWLLAHPMHVEAQQKLSRAYVASERSWETTADDYEELYQELAHDRVAVGMADPIGPERAHTEPQATGGFSARR